MTSEPMIALSAASVGIALTGALLALRAAPTANERIWLAIVFALFAGVAALPLVVAFARPLYVFYMPLVLPLFLGLSPAIALYVRARTLGRNPLSPHWSHGGLPLAGLIVTAGYWALPGDARARMFIDGDLPPGLAPSILALTTFLLIGVWSLVSLGYLVAALRGLRHFRRLLKDHYSNTQTRELRWIDWLMAGLVCLWLAAAAALVSDNFGPGLIIAGEWVFAITIGLLLFLIAAALTPTPDTEDPLSPLAPLDEEARGAKYQRSALSADMAEDLASRIEAAMRDDRLHLDPNLSLQKLATHVRAAPNLVSQTLNERMGSTFFDYIASWRITAAKDRLRSSDSSVLTVALDVGFNSRSTFYKAFKRETGVTPKAYREARN